MSRKKSNSNVVELPQPDIETNPTTPETPNEVTPVTLDGNETIPLPAPLPITLNVINLVGNVGADPDIRFFESGSIKVSLSLAVRRPTKDSTPDWFTIELWGKTAEIAGDYIKKGSQIGITGYLKIETWNDRTTGALRSRPVIKADQLYLLGSKRNQEDTETYE